MFFRILKRDLWRKRTMNVILSLFIILATMFLASSVSNLSAVMGAVDYFMEISKVPDYFTVALKDGSEDAIADYLAGSSDVAEYEVMNGFIVTNERISILKAADKKADKYERTNTLAVQAVPENFMRVFDRDDNPIQLENGEIAFCKVEAEANHLSVGDQVSICVGEVEQKFTIAAITKDVVFGSSMMGYKRLLITSEDFERFTMQEDYREIGIMKAIGMREAGIRGVYMVKYVGLSIVGAVIGLAFSFPFGELLLERAIVNLVVERAGGSYPVHITCAVGVVGIVLAFCYLSTGKLRRFSAIDAIRNGSTGERYQVKNPLKLWRRKRMNPRLYLACNDILSAPKRFLVLLVTFCIGTMLILLPLAALHTLKGEQIITMFGIASSDVYIDMGHGDDYVAAKRVEVIQADLDELEKTMRAHGIAAKTGTDVGYLIPCYADDPEELYNHMTLQAIGSWERSYALLDGREPVYANELMITERTAEEMGVSIGDTVYFKYPDEAEEYVITGTYQSMMDMGYGYRVLHSGALSIDTEAKRVFLDARELSLTVKEYELLLLLAKNPGKTLHKDFLFQQIWGIDSFSENQTLTVHIKTLRDKIEDAPKQPRRIQTVWGVGYRYEEI